MNYFLNCQIEKPCLQGIKDLVKTYFAKTNLNQRINARGGSEQMAALLKPYLGGDCTKRLCKQTATKGCEFHSKYN